MVVLFIRAMSARQTPLPACYREKCTNKEAYESIDALIALKVAGETLRDVGVLHETLADRIVPDKNFLRTRKTRLYEGRRKQSKTKGDGEGWDDTEWEICDRLRCLSRDPPEPVLTPAIGPTSRSSSPAPETTGIQSTSSPFVKKYRGESSTIGRRSDRHRHLQELCQVWCTCTATIQNLVPPSHWVISMSGWLSTCILRSMKWDRTSSSGPIAEIASRLILPYECDTSRSTRHTTTLATPHIDTNGGVVSYRKTSM